MRVYFMLNGHIKAFDMLNAPDDEGRIAEARQLFDELVPINYADAFEIWEGPRFVYGWPENRVQPEVNRQPVVL